jgi:antitoxin VapB
MALNNSDSEKQPVTQGLAERLLIIGRDCASRFAEPYRSAEHGDLLYDENGPPDSGPPNAVPT